MPAKRGAAKESGREENMEFTAKARFVRVSPQKARLVLGLIKGKRVEAALNTLAFTNKGIAPAVTKVLRSAVENANYLSAEKGLDVDVDNLYVKNAMANEGPRMKRIRPAPMGRAYRYQRRMAHIEIELAEKTKAAVGVGGEAAPAEARRPASPLPRRLAGQEGGGQEGSGKEGRKGSNAARPGSRDPSRIQFSGGARVHKPK